MIFLFLIAGAFGAASGPGAFLVRSFHLASLYIPLYLGLCAYALMAEGCRKLLAGLNFSLVPFLTLTLLLHVLGGNEEIALSRKLIQGTGRGLSAGFLLLLLAVEGALIYKLGEQLFPGEKWLPDADALKGVFRRFPERFRGLSPRREEPLSKEKAPPSPPPLPEEAFPLPDLPAAPEPMMSRDDSEIQALISSVLRPLPPEEERFNPEKTLSIEEVVPPRVSEKPSASPGKQPAPSAVHSHKADPGIDFLLEGEPPAEEASLPEAEAPWEIPGAPGDEAPRPEEEFIPPEPEWTEPFPAPPVYDEDEGDGLPAEEERPAFPEPEEEPFPEEEGSAEELPAETDEDIEVDVEVEIEADADVESDEEAYDDAYDEAGYMADRLDDLDRWRAAPEKEPAESHSVEDKMSPAGESEQLGTAPQGFLPKHKRWRKYEIPVQGLLKEYPDEGFDQIDDDTRRAARALEETLFEFKIDAKVTGISKGPVITMFELQPAPGVKVSRIVNLQDNLALRLAASRIRIVAPIPGKQAIGIEVPNKKRTLVSFRELVCSDSFTKKQYEIPVILGKDISGGSQVIDLARTPHLLIAGSTGSGKSVCVNSLICSILYQKSPQDVKLMMVDPKIVELKLYNDIPHLLTPVITEPKRAFQAVQWCLYEMERRYSLLDAMGVRDIKSYNRRIKEREIATVSLPYIVLVIDEFADLMATSGKELEGIVARLAAMSRAVGIHLVLATQRPSIDVITGLIKANFPSRIAFMVASKTDSRIIIDMMGAEKLLGKGDMLFTSAWDPFPSRMQGSFLAEEEVERVVSYVKTLGEPEYIDDEIFLDEEDDYESDSSGESTFNDPLFNKSLEIVMQAGKASASYLQRRLKIGYNRAARLVEEMEIRGIVGPQNGSKPRDIIHVPDNPGARDLTD